jgi:hypothetical protein
MRRTQIRYPHARLMPLTTRTCNRPPPVICLIDVRNRKNIPGRVPPSSVSCNTTLEHTRHSLSPCLALCSIVCFVFTISSPSFSLDRHRDCRRRCYVQLLCRQPDHFNRASRQAFPPLLIIPISPTSLYCLH